MGIGLFVVALDGRAKRVLPRDDGEDVVSGDEFEVVNDTEVGGIGHRDGERPALPLQRQHRALHRDLGRDQLDDFQIDLESGQVDRWHSVLPRQHLGDLGFLRTASEGSITHVISVTYTFSDFARPPISSTVLNRLSRALRGRERMAIACASVLPAPSEVVRAAIAGAPEALASRDPGGSARPGPGIP